MQTLQPKKLLSIDEAIQLRKKARKEHLSVVLTNGCFDILHPGHVQFLQHAKSLGDLLFVALNSDLSVKALKGPSRPIHRELERAFILSALECVDGIVIFNTPRLSKEILFLEPDIYTKASDYSIDSINPEEKLALETVNAKIIFSPFVQGHSTTSILKKQEIL